MNRAEQYREKAEEIERKLAELMSEEDRSALQRVADGWRALERQAREAAARGR